MTEPNKCRRCSDCVGMSHHWLSDCADTLDPDDEDFDIGQYGCKHCDQRGNECPTCFGEGNAENGDQCSTCSGEGVVAITEQEYDHEMYRIVERN